MVRNRVFSFVGSRKVQYHSSEVKHTAKQNKYNELAIRSTVNMGS